MASLAPPAAANPVESPASSDGEDGAGVQVNSSDQWVTRCICVNNSQVEGFMIECERCQVWQHGDCVRVDKGKVPDEYFCELCRPELHDARGLWTGGVRTQQTGKVAVSRSNSSKKKKAKSRKQLPQGVTPAAITAAVNGVGEVSSDNAMIDVRGTSVQPDPTPPGAVVPDTTSNGGADDDQKNLSREERKIVKIMQTIQLMEDRDKKRRRSGGTSATPDQQGSVTKGQSADEQTNRRRKSRPTSAAKRAAGFDVPMLTIGGYDVEQLKTSPALLRNLFPVSPMYLGSKVFLLQQVTLMENLSNGIASLPGSPILHLKDRPLHALMHSASDEKRRSFSDERMTCRSPSPASRPGPSNLSANSSPFSSQPLSPAVAVAPGSPVNASSIRPAVPTAEVSIRQSVTAEQITNVSMSVEVPVQAAVDSSIAKPVLSSIPRLSTIPKVSLDPARSTDRANPITPVPVISKTSVFNPVPIPPIAVTGAVTPLSSLSELMQSYMNAPPTEFNPPGPLEVTRFKIVNPGGVLPPPSVPLVPPRWNLDPSSAALPIPLPPSRFLPATPFRRVVPPAPSHLQTNNQRSHPS